MGIFFLPLWILSGRAQFKARIAQSISLDPKLLLYNCKLLDYIQKQRTLGRTVILATAANERIARAVADHLQCFDDVLASSSDINLKGRRKLDELVQRYGPHGFDYAGDTAADIPIWKMSNLAIYAGGTQSVYRKLQGTCELPLSLSEGLHADWRQILRVHQWAKNLIIFIPLLAAHAFMDLPYIKSDMLMFIAFCACASATYIFNDLLDLPVDRCHPDKRHRPFASGKLSLQAGLILSVALAAAGLWLAAGISSAALAVIMIYMAMTLAYTLEPVWLC